MFNVARTETGTKECWDGLPSNEEDLLNILEETRFGEISTAETCCILLAMISCITVIGIPLTCWLCNRLWSKDGEGIVKKLLKNLIPFKPLLSSFNLRNLPYMCYSSRGV